MEYRKQITDSKPEKVWLLYNIKCSNLTFSMTIVVWEIINLLYHQKTWKVMKGNKLTVHKDVRVIFKQLPTKKKC